MAIDREKIERIRLLDARGMDPGEGAMEFLLGQIDILLTERDGGYPWVAQAEARRAAGYISDGAQGA
jgi:hypothetical protein